MRLPVEPVIIGALNHLLATQSWATARLEPHAGDVIRLALGATEIDLAVTAGGMVETAADRAPAVTIGVPLSALPRLLARDLQARRSVTVTGNVALAADLEYLFANLRWDMEADLSRIVGDIAAHRIGRAGRAVAGLPGAVGESLARSSRQFLVEERAVLARADEVSAFIDEVDHLRDDAERLESRVARLEASRQPTRSPAGR
ncbi:MAG: SCP2 sterol-binding domain-containing protein [Burkholderiales bacterium]|jgi:ubiquinone biosynthesis accessory factor UbiJ|nr:SCP2 sterol-binding domain-containing protein [Burkholderiales bacterium]